MLFNSLPFIFLFLPISLFVYLILNKKRLIQLSIVWLMLCSLFFYAWWNVKYLPLLVISILINFIIGRLIFNTSSQQSKKTALIAGVIFNIALLAFYKYTGFFLENIHWLLNNANLIEKITLPIGLGFLIFGSIAYKLKSQQHNTLALFILIGFLIAALIYSLDATPLLANTQWLLQKKLDAKHIILPIGISFFTFTQIAFLVDVYLKKASEYRLTHYTLFASYFPHLLAGPIIHHTEIMPQLTKLKNKFFQHRHFYLGLTLFTMGLFKKVVIADTFAIWANHGYANVSHLGILQAWNTVLSYTFQLYFDFSGYTDMALGISLLFNIKLPINFNSPYKSLSIREFWQRWHITLGRFLKNYLYIFLGGNRVSDSKVIRNLIIVFLIGGIWHGAGWTFIIWGLLHGIAISIRNLWQKTNIVLPKIVAWFLTFSFINITWIFFRAKDCKSALMMLKGCFNIHNVTTFNPLAVLAVITGFLVCIIAKNSNELIESKVLAWKITPIITGSLFLFSIYVLLIRSSSAFLYFQF